MSLRKTAFRAETRLHGGTQNCGVGRASFGWQTRCNFDQKVGHLKFLTFIAKGCRTKM